MRDFVNVEDFSVGYFGDERREHTGADLFRSIINKGHLSIRALASSRAEQVRFQRFLWNKDVTLEEIKLNAFDRTASLAKGIDHVLCIQDTTEIDFSKRQNDIVDLGCLMNRDSVGTYLHPALALDARDDFILGLSGFKCFEFDKNRSKRENSRENRRPIEEKTSFKWLQCAEESKETLSGARMVTFISDRESDIYEYLARIPDEKHHILVRSRMDRPVDCNDGTLEDLSSFIGKLPVVDTQNIIVPAKISAKSVTAKIMQHVDRKERQATVELRFSHVMIHIPQSRSIKKPENERRKIPLCVVDVVEKIPSNSHLQNGDEPIHWRLLTTHDLGGKESAWQIVNWYKKRWHIEQLFRSAKRGGMKLDDIALSKGDSIKKLSLIGLLASVRILQLTLCRDGTIDRPASTVFSADEQNILRLLCDKYEGKTQKQKNPFKIATMAWAYWIIGRLGGWKGYQQSEGPAGPVTLKRGLDEFSSVMSGWNLAKKSENVCTT